MILVDPTSESVHRDWKVRFLKSLYHVHLFSSKEVHLDRVNEFKKTKLE